MKIRLCSALVGLLVLLSTVFVLPVRAEEVSLQGIVPPITLTAKLSGCWTIVARAEVNVVIGEGASSISLSLAPKDVALVCVKGERTVSFIFAPDGSGGGTVTYMNEISGSSFSVAYTNSGGGSVVGVTLTRTRQDSSLSVSYTNAAGETVVWVIFSKDW